ncbi:MAG: penicillin-binding protein 2 [Gammaproteobacteria bacterium]|nr:penicillin-binding protein 2 [Gammaproteobacteria bacterium]MBU1775269.1 penicillin-binding protein 2 [Gammaproteobacteria bacterium]MBU1968066.1 penicillin-binding protein 2 [Gammaproteobacteria bacterium]
MNRNIELKNHQREIYYFRLRLVLSLVIVAVMLLLLLARFFYLQVVRHDYFHTLSDGNRIYVLPIVPNRGLILDRNGLVMARNYSGYTLEIEPAKVKGMDALIAELSKLIEITPQDIKRFKRLLNERQATGTIPIRSRLSNEEVARIAAQRFRFQGIEIKARLFREYPYNDVTSHLIGYVGRINQKDIEQLERQGIASNYMGSDYIGKTGVEQRYEKELHGTAGFERVEVDAGGRAVRVLSRTAPLSGSNLVLTLDAKLQEVAEQAFGDYRGALVAIDPTNGEVLAFISKPGYDPSLFIDGIDTETWDTLNNSPDTPLNNRALRGQYPPGSTIKPFMALAGLHYGTRSPERTISDPGYFTLPGSRHQYRDWKSGGHGSVDMFKSIVVSCDTYYYGLATEMGIDNMHGYLSGFGFGKKTGLDMDGETSGLLPSSEWKSKRHNQIWYPGDTVSAGIGQGYNLVTPLQLAFATATLTNDGIAFQPHLVKELQNSPGDTVPTEPTQLFDLQIPAEHLKLVKGAMEAVTRPGGTAVGANYGVKYRVAGKTGTAQVIAMKQGEKYDEKKVSEYNRDHAWFIAFAPADKPRIAMAVLVENGGHGGSTAAPIARKVLDYYLLGQTPTPLQAVDERAGLESD